LVLLALLGGCDQDVCADYPGRACIALETFSEANLPIDQLQLDSDVLQLFARRAPDPPRKQAVHPPVLLAIIPDNPVDSIEGDLLVNGLNQGVPQGGDQIHFVLARGQHTKIVAHLDFTPGFPDLLGLDLGASDLASTDLGQNDLGDLAGVDLAVVTPTMAPAQGGLVGGPITAIARDPSLFTEVATAGGGVFRSADFSSWQAVNNGITELSIEHLAADPTHDGTLYADSFNLFPPKIFRTTDRGDHWSVLNLPAAVSGFMGPIAVDPGNGKPLFVFGGDVYRADDGVNFAIINGASPLPKTGSSADVPFQLLFTQAGHTIAVASSGLFRSTDGGVTWNPANTGLPSTRFLDNMGRDSATGALYMAGPQMFKSTDDGQSWTQLTASGLPSLGAFGMAAGSGFVFGFDISSGGTAGIQRSSNDGSSFSDFSTGLGESELTAVLPLAPSLFLAATRNHGFFTSSGTSWSLASNGLNAVAVFSLAVGGSQAFAGSVGAVFRSLDGGASWTAVGAGLPDEPVTAMAVDPSGSGLVFAGLTQFKGIFASGNGGASFTTSSTGLGSTSEVRQFLFDPRDPAALWAATATGPFRSADHGGSWQGFTTGMVRGACCADLETTGMVMDPASSQTLWASSRNGVWATSNGGNNWSMTALTGDVGSIDIDRQRSPRRLYAATTSTVMRSDDGGSTWSDLHMPLAVDGFSLPRVAVDPLDGNRVFAADVTGCFFSGNAGAAWTRIDGQSVPLRSSSLVVDTNHVAWLGTRAAGGLFKSR
jgi:photosystem II stability/assembly factor-like uncharacterized protein